MVLGSLFVALSATPLPCWLYAPWALVMVRWLVIGRFHRNARARRIRFLLVTGFALVTVVAAGCELSYRFPTRLPDRTFCSLTIVGNSISAGMFGLDSQPGRSSFETSTA